MQLLVTGGMGFIGSNFIRYHLSHYPKDQVVNLDVLSYAANPANLADLNQENYHFYQGDINDRDFVSHLVQQFKIDLIINFAAESAVDRSLTDSPTFIQTNVAGINHLIQVALKEKVWRLIQISTDEVYGSLPDFQFAAETAALNPSSPYAATKAAADLLVLAAHKSDHLGFNIIRSTNNYGPRQHGEKLIPKVITAFLAGKTIPLYGTGENRRDWLYVADNLRAIETVIHYGKIGEIYNVGTQKDYSNRNVIKTIAADLAQDLSQVQSVADRRGHDQRYGVQTAKIRALGWQPQVNFATGIKKTIAWYQANRQWWDGKIDK